MDFIQASKLHSELLFRTVATIVTLEVSHPGRSQVAQKLWTNCRHRSNHERINPVGSPVSHVLADDDKQIDK
jgi:hypothetical protein